MRRAIIFAVAIWLAFGLVCLIAERVHAGESQERLAPRLQEANETHRSIPPGLAKVMAEGAGRVVNPTCDDVRAVVAWIGEARAVQMAREAGATDGQITVARRCLTRK